MFLNTVKNILNQRLNLYKIEEKNNNIYSMKEVFQFMLQSLNIV